MPNLFLIRHGEAEHQQWYSDFERPLTPKGKNAVAKLSEHLLTLDLPMEAIWHSPLVRARETAEILGEQLNLSLFSKPFLTPDGKTTQVLQELTGQTNHLVLVSHLPLIAHFTQTLCGQSVSFYPGTCALVERPNEFSFSGLFKWVKHTG